jgi:hypothetical protein
MAEDWEDGRCRYGHCVLLIVVAMVLLMELSMVLAMVEDWEDGRCRYGHCVMSMAVLILEDREDGE